MKGTYKFIRWEAKRSACAGHYGSYSIAIVPILQNVRSGKEVAGKTVYRINHVNWGNDVLMMEIAKQIVLAATERGFTHENYDKAVFTNTKNIFLEGVSA